MPPRNIKKSKAEGLFKRCKHLSWDRCECTWWGRKKRSKVSLEKWAGVPIRSKEQAKAIFSRMENAVLAGTFDRRGEHVTAPAGEKTFKEFLDEDYIPRHVEKHRLRSNSLDSYLNTFRCQFGPHRLNVLANDPEMFEQWLEALQKEREWTSASYNRYVQHGHAMFKWALKRKLVQKNPFSIIEMLPGANSREKRFAADQISALFAACDKLDDPPRSRLVKVTPELVTEIRRRAVAGELQRDIAASVELSRPLVCQIVNGRIWNPLIRRRRVGAEMRRRLTAACDLGLRAGEMLLIQNKHVDHANWMINLPPENTKGGATTGKVEHVFVESEAVKAILTERRLLGPDAFVFGKENGRYVGDFTKSWHRLFKRAGIMPGRKEGHDWHDLRHEYASYLVEKGAKIHEVKELMRHRDITTTEKYFTAQNERLRELARRAQRNR